MQAGYWLDLIRQWCWQRWAPMSSKLSSLEKETRRGNGARLSTQKTNPCQHTLCHLTKANDRWHWTLNLSVATVFWQSWSRIPMYLYTISFQSKQKSLEWTITQLKSTTIGLFRLRFQGTLKEVKWRTTQHLIWQFKRKLAICTWPAIQKGNRKK